MKEIIAVVRVNFINDDGKETTKDIITKNGLGFVVGPGKDGGAYYEAPEKMTNAEMHAAIAMDNYKDTPLGVELYNKAVAAIKENENVEEQKHTEEAIKYMMNEISSDEFIRHVIYSFFNNNKFSNDSVLEKVNNAQDIYISAIARLAITAEVEERIMRCFRIGKTNRKFINVLKDVPKLSIDKKVGLYFEEFEYEVSLMRRAIVNARKLANSYDNFIKATVIEK